MYEKISEVLINGLKGANSHIDPLKALSDLNVEKARQKIGNYPHSIWEILHHIVVWQNVLIENLVGNNPDWSAVQNWPTEESMKIDENFAKLLETFKYGYTKLNELIKSIDLFEQMSKEYPDPKINLVMVAVTHNSYHLGQIMFLKKSL